MLKGRSSQRSAARSWCHLSDLLRGRIESSGIGRAERTGWRSRVRGDKSKLAEDGYLLSPRELFDLCGVVVFAIAPTIGERRLKVVLRDDAAEHFARVAVDAHDAERPFALGQLAQQAVKASRGRVSPPTRPFRV
jgi:hypothetical protein